MIKTWFVMVREYIETVRTRTFLISLLLTPAILGSTLWLVSRVEEGQRSAVGMRTILVSDSGDQVGGELQAAVAAFNATSPHRPVQFRELGATEEPVPAGTPLPPAIAQDVERQVVSGVLFITADAVTSRGEVRLFTRGRTNDDFALEREVQSIVTNAVRQKRLANAGIPPESRAEFSREVVFKRFNAGAKKATRGGVDMAAMMMPFCFMMLMFTGVFGTGQALLTSVIEEKSSRVVELLLSSVTPFQLMAGKILGLAAVGLTLISVWAVVALMGASWFHMQHLVNGRHLVYFVVYFVLGFVVLASIIAAIGSPCNSLKEAQGAMSFISIILIIPMVLWAPLAQHPNGALAVILSFVPPLTPMVMMTRIVSSPEIPQYQVALSISWLAVSAVGCIWIAGRIFRVGVLMYGKPASLREIARWIRRD